MKPYPRRAVLASVFFLSNSAYIFSFLIPGSVTNTLSLFVLLLSAYIWLLNIEELWPFFLYVFGLLFAAVSGFAIEHLELYLFEIRESGKVTGAIGANSALMASFLTSAFMSFFYFSKKQPYHSEITHSREHTLLRLAIALAFSLPLYLLAIVAIYGSPLTLGVDRFDYWTDVAPPGTSKVRYFMVFFAFVISYARQTGLLKPALTSTWILVAILALILHGEKFSGLLLLLYFYITPFFLISFRARHRKLLLKASILIALLISITFLNYVAILGDLSAAAGLFLARLALQGQMNYALFNIQTEYDIAGLITHFFGFGGSNTDAGMTYLMYLIAPHEIVTRRLEQGTSFTAPFPGNMIHFYGFWGGWIAVLASAIFTGWLFSLLKSSVLKRNFTLSTLLALTTYYAYGAIIMGNVNKLFEWKFALFLYLISSFYFIYTTSSSFKHNRLRPTKAAPEHQTIDRLEKPRPADRW